MLGTCHRVRRARCRLRARRTCCSYPLARPCAVVWCCVLAGPRLSARAMLPSACLAHGGETEVETARARLSGVVPRTVSTLVSIHRHHSKRRQPKGHDLGLSRLASSARRALELKARVASEPPAPASRHGSFRDRLYHIQLTSIQQEGSKSRVLLAWRQTRLFAATRRASPRSSWAPTTAE